MRRFLRDNSLSIVFLALFLAALFGQAIAGHADYNDVADRHGDPHLSLARYVVSSEFGSAVMENWQSEYLQFTLMILLTVWLLQKGSPESKELDKAGRESDQAQRVGPYAQQNSPRWAKVGGIRRKLYENSLVLVMGSFWIGTWLAQSVTGWSGTTATASVTSRTRWPGRTTSRARTSGRTRSRTGSPSSSRWARWRSSPCTCASAARRSPSRSGRRTARPA